MNTISRLRNEFQRTMLSQGWSAAFTRITKWALCSATPQSWVPRLMRKRHAYLSSELDRQFNSTVHYGAFKGLKLSNDLPWGLEDRAALLLGIYEAEVISEIEKSTEKCKVFVDLGAADGYYAIGGLVARMFEKAYCYEATEEGQIAIAANALLNDVSEQVEVRGIASSGFHEAIPPEDRDACLVLVDIEGGEFELFDEKTFEAFGQSVVIIETHEAPNVLEESQITKLISQASKTHRASSFVTGPKDPAKFPELREYADYDRWLICSERRKYLQTWLRFDPIN